MIEVDSFILGLRGSLNFTEFGLLTELSAGPLAPWEVCALMRVGHGGVGPYIQRLRRNGYIQSVKRGKGNKVNYVLTLKGRKVLKQIRNSIKI